MYPTAHNQDRRRKNQKGIGDSSRMNAEQSKTHGEKERSAVLLDKAKQTEQRPRTDEESVKKHRQKTARGEKPKKNTMTLAIVLI